MHFREPTYSSDIYLAKYAAKLICLKHLWNCPFKILLVRSQPQMELALLHIPEIHLLTKHHFLFIHGTGAGCHALLQWIFLT